MKTIWTLALALAVVAGIVMPTQAVNTCTGYNVSNMCVPAANILEGTLATGVAGSGCGATNLAQGVAITYDIRASSAAFGVAPNQSTFTAAGVLQLAAALGSLYGGNGADLHTCSVGAVPYFTSTGVEACLSAGTQNYVLQANGAGAPSFTNAPTVLGTNVTASRLNVNSNRVAGKLGIALALSPGTAFAAGTNQVLVLQFG